MKLSDELIQVAHDERDTDYPAAEDMTHEIIVATLIDTLENAKPRIQH